MSTIDNQPLMRAAWYERKGAAREVLQVGQMSVPEPGTGITIPVGTHFQFRTIGAYELHLLIATMPPWPGAHVERYLVGRVLGMIVVVPRNAHRRSKSPNSVSISGEICVSNSSFTIKPSAPAAMPAVR